MAVVFAVRVTGILTSKTISGRRRAPLRLIAPQGGLRMAATPRGAVGKTSPFLRRRDADRRIASAKLAMRAILPLQLFPAHKKELLTICLWKLTEAEGRGKYATRYCSLRALSAPRSELEHEHVFERRKLVSLLLRDPSKVDEVARLAVGCVVTREEHARLTKICRDNPDLSGWERYRAAQIEVVDRATGRTFGHPE